KAHCRRAAPHRGAGGRAVVAVRSRGRGGDESVSLPAHVPRGGRHDAAPVRPAYADASRGGSPTANLRQHFGDRVYGRLWRSLDVQPPLSTHRGIEPERLSGIGASGGIIYGKNATRQKSRAAWGCRCPKRRLLGRLLGTA